MLTVHHAGLYDDGGGICWRVSPWLNMSMHHKREDWCSSSVQQRLCYHGVYICYFLLEDRASFSQCRCSFEAFVYLLSDTGALFCNVLLCETFTLCVYIKMMILAMQSSIFCLQTLLMRVKQGHWSLSQRTLSEKQEHPGQVPIRTHTPFTQFGDSRWPLLFNLKDTSHIKSGFRFIRPLNSSKQVGEGTFEVNFRNKINLLVVHF